jgi:hypothetical protein
MPMTFAHDLKYLVKTKYGCHKLLCSFWCLRSSGLGILKYMGSGNKINIHRQLISTRNVGTGSVMLQ